MEYDPRQQKPLLLIWAGGGKWQILFYTVGRHELELPWVGPESRRISRDSLPRSVRYIIFKRYLYTRLESICARI
jgi:hypothetical protein